MRTFIFIFFTFFLFSCSGNQDEPPVKKKDSIIDSSTQKIISDTAQKGIFEKNLSYSIIGNRSEISLKNDSLKKVIDNWLKNSGSSNIDSLIDFSLELTKQALTFSFGKCPSDPELLTQTRLANCVGYASFFNSILNYALEQKGLSNQYHSEHLVGKIYYKGENVNALFKDPFFKDHDFNVIRNSVGGTVIAVDPSLYEYLGVRRISLQELPPKQH
jgi:hypothetical protein